MLDITQIPAPRIPLIDERTGLLSRQWYRFFYNLYVLTGGGTNAITLEELQLGPPNQPDFTEILKEVNNNISPEYQDQSGNFLATLDAAQLMAMMARFETAEAAIQGAYLQPVVQTGTIANYNLDNSPTAGGVVYGTGSAMAVSVAGTSGQVLKSNAAGAPTWVTDGGGTVTSVAASVPAFLSISGSPVTTSGTLAITLSGTALPVLNGGTGVTTSTGTGNTVLSAAPTLSGNVTLSTGNLIVANGQGIDFSATAGTGTSELFADYEEGTWSATLTASITPPTTPIVVTGQYTKIGRQVTCTASFNAVDTTGALGNMQIGGIPYGIGSGESYGVVGQLNFGVDVLICSAVASVDPTRLSIRSATTTIFTPISAGVSKYLLLTIVYTV